MLILRGLSTFTLTSTVKDAIKRQRVDIFNIFSDTNSRLMVVEGDVSEQGDRMTVLGSSVDLWDDRIIALEVANVDVAERLSSLEETILSMW